MCQYLKPTNLYSIEEQSLNKMYYIIKVIASDFVLLCSFNYFLSIFLNEKEVIGPL